MRNVIYKITNLVSNKSYIGFTTQELNVRWNQHKTDARTRPSTHFHNAINKYPDTSWDVSVLFVALDESYLPDAEELLIAEYGTFNNGYNSTAGGRGAPSNIQSDETRRSRSASMSGRTLSDSHKQSLSNVRKGKFTGKDNWFFGKSHSEETKDNHFRGENSNLFKGWYHTPFGKFASSYEAEIAINNQITDSSIQNWCKQRCHNPISKISYVQSKYLQTLGDDIIGKTFHEIGFWFESCP